MAFNIFSMPSSSIVLLLSAAFGISSARPWDGPQPTTIYQADEWSPRPTNSPVNPRDIFRRSSVDVRVCGWLGGNSADPAICPVGSSCIHDTAHGAIGCCATSGACTAGVYTSCVDRNSKTSSGSVLVENNGVYTCPSDSLCYKNSYPGNYYQWGCGSTENATTVLTTFTNQPTDLFLQVVFTGITFTPITTTVVSTSTSSSLSSSSSATTTSFSSINAALLITATSTDSTSTSAATSAAATGTSTNKSGANKGIIAAGVIGTSAFLIALAGIILFFLRRRRNGQNNPNGSFISNLKGEGGGHTSPRNINQGNFTRIQPYGPDAYDYVSPLPTADSTREIPPEFREPILERSQTIAERQMYPTLEYPTLTNDVHPPAATPPNINMFSPTQYRGIQDRMAENAALQTPPVYWPSPPQLNEEGYPIVSDIDNFTTSYNKAIAQMSPPTPEPSAQMASVSRDLTTRSADLPPAAVPAPLYPGIGASMMGGIGGSRNVARSPQHTPQPGIGSYSPIAGYPEDSPPTAYPYPNDSDSEDDDNLYDGAEMKEMGMAQLQVMQPPGYRAIEVDNVSMRTESRLESRTGSRESWAPLELRPNREQTERLSEETRRYQLVDRPPSQAPIIHRAGLKGQGRKEEERKKSKDVSKGELEL